MLNWRVSVDKTFAQTAYKAQRTPHVELNPSPMALPLLELKLILGVALLIPPPALLRRERALLKLDNWRDDDITE